MRINPDRKGGFSLSMIPGESRKDYMKRRSKVYREVNRESYNAYVKSKRKSNPEKHRLAAEKYRKKHSEKVRSSLAEWVKKNKDKVRAYQKEYRAKNAAKRKIENLKWRTENKQAHRAQQRAYQNYKLKTDVLYKLVQISRMRMREALRVKSNKKLHSTHGLLGCTPAEFKAHLESKFDDKMSWDNYGDYWVIDHIRPIASFDLSTSENQKAAFHYTNCQPMEKLANISKSDNYESPIP